MAPFYFNFSDSRHKPILIFAKAAYVLAFLCLVLGMLWLWGRLLLCQTEEIGNGHYEVCSKSVYAPVIVGLAELAFAAVIGFYLHRFGLYEFARQTESVERRPSRLAIHHGYLRLPRKHRRHVKATSAISILVLGEGAFTFSLYLIVGRGVNHGSTINTCVAAAVVVCAAGAIIFLQALEIMGRTDLAE